MATETRLVPLPLLPYGLENQATEHILLAYMSQLQHVEEDSLDSVDGP